MKAVVVEAPSRVAYREVDAPVVGPDDVLVRSREAGLCRTDIEVMTGQFTDPRWVRFPVIPGHEWSGTVVGVGSDVTSVRAGRPRRLRGDGHRAGAARRAAEARRTGASGSRRSDFTRPGGYAELVAVPQRVVHRLPDHVSFDAGVLVEPASVVLHGVEKARPQPGESAAVIGVGTLGSLAIALLALHSPSRIVAYGIREEELELARKLGATEVVRSGEGEPARGEMDLVVETAGVPEAVELATQLCRPGGRAVLLGIAGEGRTLTLPSDLLVGKDMALIGSIAYPAATWSRVVELLADGVLELDPIVTHRFPIGEFEDAIALMDDRRGIVAKIVLEHIQ